jgi:FkbM family methyltransferase
MRGLFRFFRRLMAAMIVSFRPLRGLFFRLVWDERIFPLVLDHDVARQRLDVDLGSWRSFARLAKDHDRLHRLLCEFRGDDIRVLTDALTSTMMVPEVLRSAHGIGGVLAEPGLQTFHRLVANERATDAIANRPDLVTRIARHPSASRAVVDVVAAADGVVDDGLLAADGFVDRLIAKDRMLAKRLHRSPLAMQVVAKAVGTDPRFLDTAVQQNPSLATQISWSKPAMRALAANRTRLNQLLELPEVRRHVSTDDTLVARTLSDIPNLTRQLERTTALMEVLGGDADFVSAVLQHQPARGVAVADPTLRREMLGDPELTRGTIADNSTRDLLFSNAEWLSQLLEDARIVDEVASRDSLVIQLVRRDPVLRCIRGNPWLLAQLLRSPEAREFIANDPQLLASVLDSEQGREVVLGNPAILRPIVSSDEARDVTLFSPPLLEELLGSEQAAALIAVRPALCKKILEQVDVAETVGAEGPVRDQILREPQTVNDVLSCIEPTNNLDVALHAEGVVAFNRFLSRLRPFLAPLDEETEARIVAARGEIRGAQQAERMLVNLLVRNGRIALANGDLRFPDERSLRTVLKELFVYEEYFFETDRESPRILDCGAGFGLAVFYFKQLHPAARITSFEPLPDSFALATRNVENAEFTDVEVLPYALSDQCGESTFFSSRLEPMGGSLTERRKDFEDEVLGEHRVVTRRLSDYLTAPVDFLKLDIEGSEFAVLSEAADSLANVHHLFCEYHHGGGVPTDRLAHILRILDAAGFDHQVAKSTNFARDTSCRPLEFVTMPYSAVIWATNTRWNQGPAGRQTGNDDSRSSTANRSVRG